MPEEYLIESYIGKVRKEGVLHTYLYRTEEIQEDWPLQESREKLLDEVSQRKLMEALKEEVEESEGDERKRLINEFAAIDSGKSLKAVFSFREDYPEDVFLALLRFLETDVSTELVKFAKEYPDTVNEVIGRPAGLKDKLEVLYDNRGKFSEELRSALVKAKMWDETEKEDLDELLRILTDGSISGELKEDIVSDMVKGAGRSDELRDHFFEMREEILANSDAELTEKYLSHLVRVEDGDIREFLQTFDYSGLDTSYEEILGDRIVEIDEVRFELSELEYTEEVMEIESALQCDIDFFADGKNLMEDSYGEFELALSVTGLMTSVLELRDKLRCDYVELYCGEGHLNCPNVWWSFRKYGGELVIETTIQDQENFYSIDSSEFIEELLRLKERLLDFMEEENLSSVAGIEKSEIEEKASDLEDLRDDWAE